MNTLHSGGKCAFLPLLVLTALPPLKHVHLSKDSLFSLMKLSEAKGLAWTQSGLSRDTSVSQVERVKHRPISDVSAPTALVQCVS